MKKYIITFLLAACACTPFVEARSAEKKARKAAQKAEKKRKKEEKKAKKIRKKAEKKEMKVLDKELKQRIDSAYNKLKDGISKQFENNSQETILQVIDVLSRPPIPAEKRVDLSTEEQAELAELSSKISLLKAEIVAEAGKTIQTRKIKALAWSAQRLFLRAVKEAVSKVVKDKNIYKSVKEVITLQTRFNEIAIPRMDGEPPAHEAAPTAQ